MVCFMVACAVRRAATAKAPLFIYIEAGKIDPIGQRTDSGRPRASMNYICAPLRSAASRRPEWYFASNPIMNISRAPTIPELTVELDRQLSLPEGLRRSQRIGAGELSGAQRAMKLAHP